MTPPKIKLTEQKFWLLKSEPNHYSIDSLMRDRRTLWTGVRNYQARNYMMKEMAVGDQILFYHSNAAPPGIAGLAKIVATPLPDPTALDKKSEYFDPKATFDNPVWFCAEIEFEKKFLKLLELSQLRADKKLKDLLLLAKGQRLSVQPVHSLHFHHIVELAKNHD